MSSLHESQKAALATVAAAPALSVTRRTIRTVPTYSAAERSVDWLSDQGFPVEHVAIVGSGLRSVEQVAGRMTTRRAAQQGAAAGALLGVFWSAFFSLFFTLSAGDFWGLLAYSALAGAAFGAVAAALTHASTQGRRDFTSSTEVRADRYELQIDDGFADDAERLLARMPSAHAVAR